MDALFVLIPVSLFLAIGALFGFIWAAKTGQFSDLSAPAERVVFDDLD